MSELQWKIPRGPAVAPKAFLDAGCTPLLAAVLHARGMTAPEQARSFLDNGPEQLCDPLAMRDLSRAAARLEQARAAGEHIAVYGDYDVDGITSSCMLTHYLRSKGLQCELYIPDRIREGYGVNIEALRMLREKGVTLVITVDCGITAVEETEQARSLGMEMLVTDHHECRETLPAAAAVVDPKRPDCDYPNPSLAGVGVAFKLICAMEGDSARVLDRYADLVALGTVADVMPLTGENRYIVRRGLDKLASDPRPGLRALMAEAGLGGKKLSASNIGFTLAPRLNASGRLGQIESAVALLLTEDPAEAARRAAELCALNRDRQEIETGIWQEALEMIGDARPDAPLVLAREGWHQGVIGIAASRLTDAFGVPAVMICLDGEHGKGSCRSCGGFNLFEALIACEGHLEGFGGHALAAGLTIRREEIDGFRGALAAYYRAHPPLDTPTLEIDLCVDRAEDLSMECVAELERLEPCGAGNPRPLLCMLGACLVEATPIGGGKHLRLRLEKDGASYEAVWFGRNAEQLSLRRGDWADVAFYPQINEFRGIQSVQLLVSDIRPHDAAPGRRILEGDYSGAAVWLPERPDFARVWRALVAREGQSQGAPCALRAALAPHMREERMCIVLKVLEELGLVRLEQAEGGILAVAAVPGAPKADLNTSRILQALRGEAAGR